MNGPGVPNLPALRTPRSPALPGVNWSWRWLCPALCGTRQSRTGWGYQSASRWHSQSLCSLWRCSWKRIKQIQITGWEANPTCLHWHWAPQTQA